MESLKNDLALDKKATTVKADDVESVDGNDTSATKSNVKAIEEVGAIQSQTTA